MADHERQVRAAIAGNATTGEDPRKASSIDVG
jgi:hypothetical protein